MPPYFTTYFTSELEVNADTCIEVYKTTNMSLVVAQNCDFNGSASRIEASISAAGAYKIKITNQSNFSGANTGYKFTAIWTAAAPVDAYEEDDTSLTSKSYSGQLQTHNFVDDTVDWVNVWMSGAGTMTYFTSELEANADTCLEVYKTTNMNVVVAQNCDFNKIQKNTKDTHAKKYKGHPRMENTKDTHAWNNKGLIRGQILKLFITATFGVSSYQNDDTFEETLINTGAEIIPQNSEQSNRVVLV